MGSGPPFFLVPKIPLQLHFNGGQRNSQETTQAQTCSLLRTNSLVAVRSFQTLI